MFEGSANHASHPPHRHSHDKFFKNVFEAFFKDLIELIHPEVADLLDLDRVVFRTEPLFGHLGKGEHVIPDLVGSAPLKNSAGERMVVVHVEIEAQHRAVMERRMWRYFSLLATRYDTEVFSVVVFLSGGPSRVEPRRYRLKIGEVEVNRFTYWALGLAACDAEEWLQKPQPLAKALAAMMKTRGDRVAHKLRCLRAAAAERDKNRLYLLQMLIDLYLKLRPEEQSRYAAALAEEKAMLPEIPDWLPLSLDEAYQQRDNLLAEGAKNGILKSILRLIDRRFGTAPAGLVVQLSAIGDTSRLEKIFDAAMDATSLAQVEAALAGG